LHTRLEKRGVGSKARPSGSNADPIAVENCCTSSLESAKAGKHIKGKTILET
jgi:hypothetical protein